MSRHIQNTIAIAILVSALAILIAITILVVRIEAQPVDPDPDPTYYCSPAAPASWRAPGCGYSWSYYARRQQGRRGP